MPHGRIGAAGFSDPRSQKGGRNSFMTKTRMFGRIAAAAAAAFAIAAASAALAHHSFAMFDGGK
jgi:hypothetical protein